MTATDPRVAPRGCLPATPHRGARSALLLSTPTPAASIPRLQEVPR
ncbi:hypothetical protein [Longispora urticae]